MAISLVYTGAPEHTEIAAATQMAHAFLQSQEIIQLVEARSKPFDDVAPFDLLPANIAHYLRDETFTLSVKDYEDPKDRRYIGGRFRPKYPEQIEINILALPRRQACEFAGVLIHESIHALSRRIRRQTNGLIHFSHVPNERTGNEETTPYWIQTQAERWLCGAALVTAEPLIIEH